MATKKTNGKLTGDAAKIVPANALSDLNQNLAALSATVEELSNLNHSNNFRYISKRHRNGLLTDLLSRSREVEDAAKGTFKILKKVKRERTPDALVDAALSVSSRPISQ